MSELGARIIEIEEKLSSIEDKSIVADLQFLIGAVGGLYKQRAKVELSFQKDKEELYSKLEKKAKKYDEIRQSLLRRDGEVTKYKQVMIQVKKLNFYFPYKYLKKELDSLAEAEVRNTPNS